MGKGFRRIAEVVVLIGAKVGAETCADNRLSVQNLWGPAQAKARTEVFGVGLVEGRAFRTEPAASSANGDRAAFHFMHHAVELVTQPDVHR